MLRIIGGEFRRRRLRTPKDASTTRPLPDRVRTAVFNMLKGHLDGRTVIDVFAGTGSFGLEAISRGAAEAVLIERDRGVGSLLKGNIEDLGAADRARPVIADALGPAALAAAPPECHVVLFDPPYPMVRDPDTRRRVFDQFARFAALLDDDGFALLRTPYPFFEPPPAHRTPETNDPDDPDAEAGPIDPNTRRVPVSLDVPGCDGPETHVYGSTAVHWYMRERS